MGTVDTRQATEQTSTRGEIWWADLDELRPVVLVSRVEAYAVRALVIAVPLTTKVRGFAVDA
jgi:mRNA-degrading endonuclease toxin of MazEF toxin-antitoxin module